MAKRYLGLKYEDFKNSFNKFFLHKKKVRALENYGSVKEFEGRKYIPILKELLQDGFLDEKEEEFLEYQICKAEIDALSWAHKTPWIKREMDRLAKAGDAFKRPVTQLYIDFDKLPSIPNIGMPIPGMQRKAPAIRVAR